MGEQSNLSIGHSPGNEPGKTKTVNAESSNAWYVNMNNGNVNTNNKTNAGRVRPVSATDKPIYDIPLSSILIIQNASYGKSPFFVKFLLPLMLIV